MYSGTSSLWLALHQANDVSHDDESSLSLHRALHQEAAAGSTRANPDSHGDAPAASDQKHSLTELPPSKRQRIVTAEVTSTPSDNNGLSEAASAPCQTTSPSIELTSPDAGGARKETATAFYVDTDKQRELVTPLHMALYVAADEGKQTSMPCQQACVSTIATSQPLCSDAGPRRHVEDDNKLQAAAR